MKEAIIRLPYLFQGDDLNYYLEESNSIDDALQAYAEMLEEASEMMWVIRQTVSGHRVKFHAGMHHIGIAGPSSVVDKLIAAGVAANETRWHVELDDDRLIGTPEEIIYDHD